MARYWQLLVKARGDTKPAQRAMRDMRKASRDLRSAVGVDFGAIAKVSAAALGVGIAASVKVGVDELLEAQRVSAQTAAVLKSTGGAAGLTGKQIEAMAGSLSQMSGVDDEAIQSGANLLLTFTNVRNSAGKNNDIFNQATAAALDMSTAMGTDLRSANMQLGKALNDPVKGITALRRVGVSFTQQQIAQIKTLTASGRTMDAQKMILAELNKEFGGSAKAAGKTAQGSINRLKNSYAEMSATILTAVMPSVAGLADRMSALVARVRAWAQTKGGKDTLEQMRNGLQQAANIVGVLAGYIGKLVATLYRYRAVLIPVAAGILAVVAALKIWRIATTAMAVAQAALNIVLTANPFGLIVLAVVGIAAALVVAYKRSETFRNIVQGLIAKLKQMGAAAMSVLRSIVAKAQPVINILKLIGRVYIAAVIANFKMIKLVAVATWNGIMSAWNKAASLFAKIRHALNFSSAFSAIQDGFKSAINAVIRLWNDLEFRIPGLPGKLSKYFDGATISTPNLPMLAAGGTITRRGAAIIGEAGPELLELPRGARVTPLSKTGNTYNITVNTNGERVDTIAFMRSLRVAARMGTI